MYYCRYKDASGNRRVSKPYPSKDMKGAYVRARRSCKAKGFTFLSVSKYYAAKAA